MRRLMAATMAVGMFAAALPGQAAGPRQQEPAPAVAAINQFALDLYAQLAKAESGNLFFSPSSISIALAMTAAGARGQTQAEMAKVLALGDRLDAAHAEHRRLLTRWNTAGADYGYPLRLANRLWVQDGYVILPAYLQLTGGDYGAAIAPVDYQGDPEASRATINQWVEEQTERKIKDLLPPDSIKKLTRLVLTNAIYFKGHWIEQFDERLTREGDFFVSAVHQARVPMMTRTARSGYAETPELQVLEMPYWGRQKMVPENRVSPDGTLYQVTKPVLESWVSMVILLPRETNGLAALEKSLSFDRLAGWLGAIERQEVNVTLPKFKLDTSLNLNETLKAMGMKLAFSQAADFSGITGREGLYISDVVHKAYVDVNEEGTEAASATGVAVTKGGARPAPAPTFRADHRFLFLIRDLQTGSILFLGRMADPTP